MHTQKRGKQGWPALGCMGKTPYLNWIFLKGKATIPINSSIASFPAGFWVLMYFGLQTILTAFLLKSTIH